VLIGVLAAVAVVLAGWGGVRALGLGPAEAGDQTVAVSSALPEPPAAPTELEAPADTEGWRAVVADLYARRAAAFADPGIADFGLVYTRSSPLRTADSEYAQDLAAAGEALRGFDPAVVSVDGVSATGDRAVVDLVDSWPAHEVVTAGDGSVVRLASGRPETVVRLVLVRAPEGWRIEGGERIG
jgi:hypothetical protein